MKKITALFAVLAVVVSLCGCCMKHSWADATCTEPKTCTKCGAAEGEPNGHLFSDWFVESEDFAEMTRSLTRTCSACGEAEYDTEEIKLDYDRVTMIRVDGNIYAWDAYTGTGYPVGEYIHNGKTLYYLNIADLPGTLVTAGYFENGGGKDTYIKFERPIKNLAGVWFDYSITPDRYDSYKDTEWYMLVLDDMSKIKHEDDYDDYIEYYDAFVLATYELADLGVEVTMSTSLSNPTENFVGMIFPRIFDTVGGITLLPGEHGSGGFYFNWDSNIILYFETPIDLTDYVLTALA